MPPLFDEASGRAASDGRCAPALPAALDHFHAKPRPRHPPSCGPRAGGNAPAAAGAGGPGWAWEPRRQFQRRAAGRERPSGQGGGREGGGDRGGGSSLSVPAQPWLNGSPAQGHCTSVLSSGSPRGYLPMSCPACRRTCPGKGQVGPCHRLSLLVVFFSSDPGLGAALAPGMGRLHSPAQLDSLICACRSAGYWHHIWDATLLPPLPPSCAHEFSLSSFGERVQLHLHHLFGVQQMPVLPPLSL